jgi:hypothetical protein
MAIACRQYSRNSTVRFTILKKTSDVSNDLRLELHEYDVQYSTVHTV